MTCGCCLHTASNKYLQGGETPYNCTTVRCSQTVRRTGLTIRHNTWDFVFKPLWRFTTKRHQLQINLPQVLRWQHYKRAAHIKSMNLRGVGFSGVDEDYAVSTGKQLPTFCQSKRPDTPKDLGSSTWTCPNLHQLSLSNNDVQSDFGAQGHWQVTGRKGDVCMNHNKIPESARRFEKRWMSGANTCLFSGHRHHALRLRSGLISVLGTTEESAVITLHQKLL
jgi:hypothetical protein